MKIIKNTHPNALKLIVILKRFSWVVLCIFCVNSIQGCFFFDEEIKELRAKINTIKSKPAAEVPLPDRMKEFPKVVYVGEGKRDPFIALNFIRGDDRVVDKCKIDRPKELLEDFPLNSLSMVGSMDQGGRMWVFIRSADDGTVHKLAIGDHLGKNFGEITKITDTEMEILEKMDNPVRGCVKQKTVKTVQ